MSALVCSEEVLISVSSEQSLQPPCLRNSSALGTTPSAPPNASARTPPPQRAPERREARQFKRMLNVFLERTQQNVTEKKLKNMIESQTYSKLVVLVVEVSKTGDLLMDGL